MTLFFKYFQDQSQAILDSSQFLNEINHFKIRLDTLEKERYDLEDKVRRLQVCFLFVVFISEINLKAFFILHLCLRRKMKHIKIVLLMEIMIGLDLGQHQRSMDVLLHRQRLVRDVL
jgi:hypothetical protein